MRIGILLVSLLLTIGASAQQPQPSDSAVATEYCEALMGKWDLLFQWARAAAPDIASGVADLDGYADRARPTVEGSYYAYERRFLERAYLQAMLVAVQLAVYSETEAAAVTLQLREGARAQCFEGVLNSLTEVPLPPRL